MCADNCSSCQTIPEAAALTFPPSRLFSTKDPEFLQQRAIDLRTYFLVGGRVRWAGHWVRPGQMFLGDCYRILPLSLYCIVAPHLALWHLDTLHLSHFASKPCANHH